jgi:hypothetical protein
MIWQLMVQTFGDSAKGLLVEFTCWPFAGWEPQAFELLRDAP